MSAVLLASALEDARSQRSRFVEELKTLVRIPSISAQAERAGDVQRCAEWLRHHLERIGLQQVQMIPSARHPYVYGEWMSAPGRPTLLIYGHYDVQPVDPLSQWRSPPFEPRIRGDSLTGRGASDDKGQFFAHLKALESALKTHGRLPVNVRVLLDGEEEIGSPDLPAFLWRNRERLKADVALMSDMAIPSPDRPAITYALRGDLKFEVVVRGPKHDLHSGLFGGAVLNPLQAISQVIASLHDANGRVSIPGFYDRVRPVKRHERSYLARTGPGDAEMLHNAAGERGWGEAEYSLYERTVLRPAVIVNGLSGGYEGQGSKAVLPAVAVAKINIRTVPNQDPVEIERLFRAHVRRVAPPGVWVEVRTLARVKPALIDPHLPVMRAAALAYRRGFGAPPVFRRSGGSIAAVTLFKEILGTPTVLMGFALPDDNAHAPNEKFSLPNFYHGIATSLWFLYLTARTPLAGAAFAARPASSASARRSKTGARL